MSTMRTPENPNAAVKPVEPLRFPLRGSRLIEASAGTGKTYTIAALYLRLVLGHGGPAAAFGYAGSRRRCPERRMNHACRNHPDR